MKLANNKPSGVLFDQFKAKKEKESSDQIMKKIREGMSKRFTGQKKAEKEGMNMNQMREAMRNRIAQM